MHITPLFNPITGDELKAIVMSAIDRGFVESGEFEGHRTFPKFSYNFRLEVKVYPATIPEHTVVTEGIQSTTEGPTEEEIRNARVLTFSQTEGVDTPDLAREQHNLPIPTPVVAKDGVVRDMPVMSARPAEPPPVQVENRSANPPAVPAVPAPKLAEGEMDPDAFDPAAALAAAGPITDEQREAIYANATKLVQGRPKVSVEQETAASLPGKGVKVGRVR